MEILDELDIWMSWRCGREEMGRGGKERRSYVCFLAAFWASLRTKRTAPTTAPEVATWAVSERPSTFRNGSCSTDVVINVDKMFPILLENWEWW